MFQPLRCLLLGCSIFTLHCAASDASDGAHPGASTRPEAQAGAGVGGASEAGQGGASPQTSEGGAAGEAGAGGSGAGGQGEPLEVIPAMFVAENVDLDPILDGDAIPLSLPPQGGHVLWIGAYLKNPASDTIELRARLRDPETGELVAEEGRTVVLRPVEGQPGLFQPDIRTVSQVTHVPACPVYGPKAIAETTYDLEVSVRELYVEPQRTAKATRSVVPSCTLMPEAGRALCQCECEANYTLGKCKDIPHTPP